MRWARQILVTSQRGLILGVVGLAAGIPLFVLSLLSILLSPLLIIVRKPPHEIALVRGFADWQREKAFAWSGIEIESPYRRRRPGARGWLAVLTDPATWRDMLWLLVNATAGTVLALLPLTLVVDGLGSFLLGPWFWFYVDEAAAGGWLIPLVGALTAVVGAVYGPMILKGHAMLAASLLSPTRKATNAKLARVTESRAQVVDTSAAELRRIERDLHDGVQVRLAALGMNIGLAEQLLKDDPDKAVALLAEARESSTAALAELRGLVRGIHPPVLAERGLDGAVRALALSLPLRVDVDSTLDGRFADPIESAVYFGVAEVLANVVKHSGASRAWVQTHYVGDRLVVLVSDNGCGGARVEAGTGLRGLAQRLGAFDGTIVVKSPIGGPTVATIEVPCEGKRTL